MGSIGLMRFAPFAALLFAGCAFDAPPAAPPNPVYEPTFREVVYPILLRDCGFPACHGDDARFFRVYGPGRHRLDPEAAIDDELEEAEVRATFERARSMLASAPSAEESLFVRKPLEIDSGGAPHLGIDQHGQDLYRTTEDPSYQALLTWARSGFSGGGGP